MYRRVARFLLLLLILQPVFPFPQRIVAVAVQPNTVAWGWNRYGQLGNGTQLSSSAPGAVESGLEDVVAVAAGERHSLALQGDGLVFAWGHNTYGQLGDSTYLHRAIPVAVAGLRGAIAIAAGEEHSLALRGDGTVVAWGSNHYGQLGRNQPLDPLGKTNARWP